MSENKLGRESRVHERSNLPELAQFVRRPPMVISAEVERLRAFGAVVHSAAVAILSKYAGFESASWGAGIELAKTPIRVGTDKDDEDLKAALYDALAVSARCGEMLVPVGTLGDNEYTLAADANGQVYGILNEDNYIVWEDIDTAIESMVTGRATFARITPAKK